MDFQICPGGINRYINPFLRFLYELSKKYQIPKEKYQPVLKLFSECVREVHSKTARLPISRKPDVGFLREFDTFKSIILKCCKLKIRFLEGWEQIWKLIQSCFI